MPTTMFSPQECRQFLNNSGAPLAGGKVYTYSAGTSTPAPTYAADSTTQNSNPVTLDAAGRAVIRLDVANAYKFVVTDAGGGIIYSVDNIPGGLPTDAVLNEMLADGSVTAEKLATGINAEAEAYLGVMKFLQAGPSAQYRTVRSKLRDIVSVKDFGAVGDGVADDRAAIQAAIDSGASSLYLPQGTYLVHNLQANAAGQTFYGPGILQFGGANTDKLMTISGADVAFDGVTFDGGQLQPHFSLINVARNTLRPRFIGCTFRNMRGTGWGSTPLNQMYALSISPYGVTDFQISNCYFEQLHKLNDGSLFPAAEGLGFVGAIVFMDGDGSVPSKPQAVVTSGLINSCHFYDIQTILAPGLSLADRIRFDDADAIRFYDVANGAGSVDVTISDCQFRKVSKRAVKISARGPVVENSDIHAADCPYAMVTAVKFNPDSIARGVRVQASATKPIYTAFQWTGIPSASGIRYSDLHDCYVSHCVNGFEFYKDSSADVIENISVRGLRILQAYGNGIIQSGSLPATQQNLEIADCEIAGGNANSAGITILIDTASRSGVRLSQVRLMNCDLKIGGMNSSLNDVAVDVTSNTWVGRNNGVGLAEIGPGKGVAGYLQIQGLHVNAANLNAGFVTASRPWVIYLAGDRLAADGVRLTVPQSLSVSSPHLVLEGDDFTVTGLSYNGAGYLQVGRYAAARGVIYNATRMGREVCNQPFFLLGSSSIGTGYMINVDGVTDFRATSAECIQCVGGATPVSPNTYSYVLQNVRAATTNVYVTTQGSRIAVINCAKF